MNQWRNIGFLNGTDLEKQTRIALRIVDLAQNIRIIRLEDIRP